MNTTLQEDARKFSEFLLEHYEPARQWEDPIGYCAWNIGHGFIAAVIKEDGTIIAMCAMRPVDRPGLGVLPYYVNEDGSCLHIDLLINPSGDERAILSFRNFFLLRFGRRKTVTLFRGDESALHVYKYDRFWKNLTKLRKRKKDKNERVEATA